MGFEIENGVLKKYHEEESITDIAISDNITSIGESAFMDCEKLESITLADSVTSIGDFAFSNCSSLTNINIPDSVVSIGEMAFSNCSSLESIIIPENVTIADNSFDFCSEKLKIYKRADITRFEIKNSILKKYHEGEDITNAVIPQQREIN